MPLRFYCLTHDARLPRMVPNRSNWASHMTAFARWCIRAFTADDQCYRLKLPCDKLARARSKTDASISADENAVGDELDDPTLLLVNKPSTRRASKPHQHKSDPALNRTSTNRAAPNEHDVNYGRNAQPVAVASSATALPPPPPVPQPTKPKSKHGVRHFLQRILGSSSHSSRHPPPAPRPTLTNGADLARESNTSAAGQPAHMRLFILRHGERLDRYYSAQWLRQAFDSDGNYCRFSPILPETLPVRAAIRDYDLDPPLTHKGLIDAVHTGNVLYEKNIDIQYCYSSPALRCVQTASKLLEGLKLQNKIKIRVEPGLFECTSWYTTTNERGKEILTMPQFLTKDEFRANKYSIERNYREQLSLVELSHLETELQFYERNHAVTTAILNMHEHEFAPEGQASTSSALHILFVAHAPSLETCTRKLCGGKFRPNILGHVIRNVDFLTMTVIEKTDRNVDKWIFRRNSFYGDEF